jgi:hypothetical protein
MDTTCQYANVCSYSKQNVLTILRSSIAGGNEYLCPNCPGKNILQFNFSKP